MGQLLSDVAALWLPVMAPALPQGWPWQASDCLEDWAGFPGGGSKSCMVQVLLDWQGFRPSTQALAWLLSHRVCP